MINIQLKIDLPTKATVQFNVHCKVKVIFRFRFTFRLRFRFMFMLRSRLRFSQSVKVKNGVKKVRVNIKSV